MIKSIHRPSASVCLGLAMAFGSIACLANNAGNLAATKFGDTSHPMAHGSPIAELRAACGNGARTASGSVIHRQPYLQRVTTNSAMLGWVTTETETEQIAVTTPAGEPIATVAGAVKHAAQRAVGERQMWAKIDGLQPDTIYCYSVIDGAPLTERTGFRTAPSADSTKSIRFLAFGDSGGGGTDQFTLRDQMYKFPFGLMIHTGDIAYDNGAIGEFEVNVFGVYAELFRNLPLFPSAGNHDYVTMQGAPFGDVFAFAGSDNKRWYSYDWGRIHFVALDTEADYMTQAKWLDADLSKSKLPWKIVYLHRPLYSTGEHGSDIPLRNALAPVLEKNHVQLVLTGHDHDYERIHPQKSVAYVVTGGGGVGTRAVGNSGFTAFSAEVIHFVVVDVGMDQLVLHAIDGTGAEFDSMVVPRL